MSIEINTIADEAEYNQYIAARNKPRDTILHGVRPNAIKCLAEYEALIAALSGDMSDFSDYHTSVVAAVSPYIELMKCAMKVLRDTPALINQGARAQDQFPPFGEGLTDEVAPEDYATLLTETVAAIQAVAGGGE